MAVSVMARFVTIGEAESARSALEAAGIDTALADDQTITVNWLYSNALGGVKILVPQEDAEEAATVITESASPDGPESGSDTAGDLRDEEVGDDRATFSGTELTSYCVSCGSEHIVRLPRLWLSVFFSIIALGVGTAIGQRSMAVAFVAAIALMALLSPSHRCAVCGDFSSPPRPTLPAAALLPLISDTAEMPCPRCGAAEVHHILYRRLRAASLIFSLGVVLIVPIWLLLPKWKCDHCGLLIWIHPPHGPS